MKKLSVALAAAAFLAACGGGSGNTSPVASAPASATVPVVTAPLAAMPVAPAKAIQLTTGELTQGANLGLFNLTFKTVVNMTVSGQQNQLWAAAAAPGGSASVTGNQNTIVFLPGTDTTVNISGSGNIFYVVQGSPIKFGGAGLATSTITYYRP